MTPYEQALAEIDWLAHESSELMRQGEAQWQEFYLSERKKRFPKKKKLPYFESEEVQKLQEPWKALFVPLVESVQKAIDQRRELLPKLAPTVEFRAQEAFECVGSSSTSTYRSQGWGAENYARGELLPLQAKLRSLGFTTEIRKGTEFLSDFELWANCPKWMAHAAAKLITIGEAVKSWGPNHNPCVYMPGAYGVMDMWLKGLKPQEPEPNGGMLMTDIAPDWLRKTKRENNMSLVMHNGKKMWFWGVVTEPEESKGLIGISMINSLHIHFRPANEIQAVEDVEVAA